MKAYHIGTTQKGSTVTFHLRDNVDYLSCELYEYYGVRETTKARLKSMKKELLKAYNQEKGKNFTKIKID